jgi:type IV secretion system protein VirD4
MQLSPNEAIVMVSGLRPVRAGKVRYYEDPQLQSRIVKPSRAAPNDRVARPDEWSGHGPISPSVELLANLKSKACDQNGGHRREPELPQQGDLVVTAPLTEYEFGVAPDEEDTDAVQAAALNRSMQGLARAISLDPDDKMGL